MLRGIAGRGPEAGVCGCVQRKETSGNRKQAGAVAYVAAPPSAAAMRCARPRRSATRIRWRADKPRISAWCLVRQEAIGVGPMRSDRSPRACGFSRSVRARRCRRSSRRSVRSSMQGAICSLGTSQVHLLVCERRVDMSKSNGVEVRQGPSTQRTGAARRMAVFQAPANAQQIQQRRRGGAGGADRARTVDV